MTLSVFNLFGIGRRDREAASQEIENRNPVGSGALHHHIFQLATKPNYIERPGFDRRALKILRRGVRLRVVPFLHFP